MKRYVLFSVSNMFRLFQFFYLFLFYFHIVFRPSSERYESWLHPPVQTHLSVYAFNVTNPKQVHYDILRLHISLPIVRNNFFDIVWILYQFLCIINLSLLPLFQVLNGSKPILQEVGPFVYQSMTDKGDNVVWHDNDNTMTYRPR
jgi:hypothetical protein